MAEDAFPYYDGPEFRLWNDLVDRELDNCRVAMAWAIEHDEREIAIRLAGALWRVWWYGHAAGTRPWTERVIEGRTWIERALALREGLPVQALTEALVGAGILARLQGDLQPGLEYGEELLHRSQDEGYGYGEFWAYYLLGCATEARGNDDAAGKHYAKALVAARSARNPENHRAAAHSQLGRIAEREGDLAQAAVHHGEALVRYRDCHNPYGISTAAWNLGRVFRMSGDSVRAAPLLRESLLIYMEDRDLGGVHASLVELAHVSILLNQVGRAGLLLAAADRYPGHPNDAHLYVKAKDIVQSRLSDADFAAVWEAGLQFGWTELMAEVDMIVSDSITATCLRGEPSVEGLTRRELEVLRLVANGGSNRSVAEDLSISERTVENHMLHILTKLDVDSRTAAATYAVRRGLA